MTPDKAGLAVVPDLLLARPSRELPMLVYCWLKRSIPGLLLLVVIACSVGLWKPPLVTPSSGRRGSKPFAPVATDALATPPLAANLTGAASRSEQICGHRTAAPSDVDDWVRTRTGWEHEAKWFATVGRYEPALHPAVVAALVSLMAVWALVAFPADTAKVADEPDGPSTTEG